MSIKSNAEVIRDETAAGANTATRVGSNLVEIAEDLIANQMFIADFSFTEKTALATGSNGSYTWEIPANTKQIEVWVVSAGRGGGSGVRGAAGTTRDGGAGGSSAGIQNSTFTKSEMTTTNILTITTPDGGLGGVANTVDSTASNPGIAGGNSIVSGDLITVTAFGASGVNNNSGNLFNPDLGAASAGNKQISFQLTQGGSGGGSINSSNLASVGGFNFNGTSANLLGANNGGGGGSNSGGAGGNATVKAVKYGGSGAGGGANLSGPGGTGGSGFRGGGGGGGGASVNGSLSGAGGKGGSGFIRVILYF
tara:strand:+ start:213 stop:1139 length:927 start_codon:yes stop_codon:yes gene_type:complete